MLRSSSLAAFQRHDERLTVASETRRLANRVRRLAAEAPDAIPQGLLTSRESEVRDLLVEGLSNKQIARRLSIQEQTVKNHVHRMLVKLGVSRRVEAAARARKQRRPTPER